MKPIDDQPEGGIWISDELGEEFWRECLAASNAMAWDFGTPGRVDRPYSLLTDGDRIILTTKEPVPRAFALKVLTVTQSSYQLHISPAFPPGKMFEALVLGKLGLIFGIVLPNGFALIVDSDPDFEPVERRFNLAPMI